MHDLIERQAVKEWLTRWEGYVDKDIIARMQYRVVDIPPARILKLSCNPPSTDCIDRQAAIKAVSEACFELRGVFGRCEDAINSIPSAQQKIIRCKDCLMHGVCRFEQGLGLDGYCSQAERREE